MNKNEKAIQQMRNLAAENVKKLKQQVIDVQQQSKEILIESMEQFFKTQLTNNEQVLAAEHAPSVGANPSNSNTAQNAAQSAIQTAQDCVNRAMKAAEQSIQNAENIINKGQ